MLVFGEKLLELPEYKRSVQPHARKPSGKKPSHDSGTYVISPPHKCRLVVISSPEPDGSLDQSQQQFSILLTLLTTNQETVCEIVSV